METTTTDTILLAAQQVADLWAEQIQKPLNKDNGDDNPMLFLLASMNTMSAQGQVNPARVEAFKTALIKRIVADLQDGQYSKSYYLSTDYAPDHILSEVAQESGIPSDAFPWKSHTNISVDSNQISYRFGYSASYQSKTII